MTDKELLIGFKSRDENALKYARADYYRMAKHIVTTVRLKYTLKISDLDAEADDLLHEALILLIRAADEDKIVLNAKLSSIFYAFARFTWLARLKKLVMADKHQKRIRIEFDDGIVEPESDDVIDDQKFQAAIDYYFLQLTDICRQILHLFWADIDIGIIEKKTGLTHRGLITRKYKCKERLVKLIRQNPDNF